MDRWCWSCASRLTGFNALTSELGAKQIALFHELLPNVPTIGFLANPSNQIDELMTTTVLAAAAGIGLRVQALKATTAREIDAAFENLVQARTKALLVSNDFFLNSQNKQIIALAARLAIPVMYGSPEFVVAGGFVSYGASLTDEYRQLGLYAGRILKGASPAELPVIQSSKFALVINLKTASARPHNSGQATRPRRRGDRIGQFLLHCMSPLLTQSRY